MSTTKLSKKRYYFRNDDDEMCYPISSHIKHMVENQIKEMDIYLAERETESHFFYCKHFFQVGEKSEQTCGKNCEAYQPRNGKSGVCKFSGFVYEKTDKCFTLKIDELKINIAFHHPKIYHGTAIAKNDIGELVKKGEPGVITAYLPDINRFAVYFSETKWITFRETEEWFKANFEIINHH